MKRKSITIYSSIIAILFCISILFFAFNLYSELKYSNERCNKTFTQLTEHIKNSNYEKNLLNNILQTNDCAAYSIVQNGKILLNYPETLNENLNNLENSKFIKLYNKQLIDNNNVTQISIALYTLRPSVIFYYAGISFVIILIGTVLTIILIIYTYANENKTQNTKKEEIKTQDNNFNINDENQNKEELIDSIITDESIEQIEWDETPKIIQEENILTVNDNINDFTDEDIKENTNNEEQKEEYTTTKLPYEENFNNSIITDVQDKYSSITGITKASFIENKLDKDLVYAASSEQDLSLFIIKIENYDYSNEKTKEIINILLEQFLYKDNIFEYEENSFAIIKNDLSIEEAEEKAEIIYSKIKSILNENQIFIGISSRAQRMLSAKRLLNEAWQALMHSISDDNNKITGFHIDIEKYREYISNN